MAASLRANPPPRSGSVDDHPEASLWRVPTPPSPSPSSSDGENDYAARVMGLGKHRKPLREPPAPDVVIDVDEPSHDEKGVEKGETSTTLEKPEKGSESAAYSGASLPIMSQNGESGGRAVCNLCRVDAGKKGARECRCRENVVALAQDAPPRNVQHAQNKASMTEAYSSAEPSSVEVATGEYVLVNITQLPEADSSAWDRFIFFSFRAQRFHFPSSTFLSAFSPFAAVASSMPDISAASVCAVCGAASALRKCQRCPLAFHSRCIDPLRRRINRRPFFCNSCRAAKGGDISPGWLPAKAPSPLPSPSTGFARLTADAWDGNPIDFVFHPTLVKYYVKECGQDWLRCHRCNEIRTAIAGVLSESVHVPFECKYAFWGSPSSRRCGGSREAEGNELAAVDSVQKYIAQRSRRRNALFYHDFGEEDREDYGLPDLTEPSFPELQPSYQTSALAAVHLTDTKIERPSFHEYREEGERNLMKTSAAKDREDIGNPGGNAILSADGGDLDFDLSFGNPDEATRFALPEESLVLESMPETEAMPTVREVNAAHAAEDCKRGARTAGPQASPPSDRKLLAETEGSAKQQEYKQTQSSPWQVDERAMTTAAGKKFLESELKPAVVVPTPAIPIVDVDALSSGPFNSKRVASTQGDKATNLPAKRVKEEVELDENMDPGPSTAKSPGIQGPDEVYQAMLDCIASLGFDEDIEDCLTDLALANDKSLYRLFTSFGDNASKFKRHATRLAQRMAVKVEPENTFVCEEKHVLKLEAMHGHPVVTESQARAGAASRKAVTLSTETLPNSQQRPRSKDFAAARMSQIEKMRTWMHDVQSRTT